MPILRAVCPGCGAGLKCTDPAGFAVGEAVTCPKCDTEFKVKAAAPVAAKPVAAKPVAKKPQVIDDDEDDRPKKKVVKATAADDDEDEDGDRPRKKKRRDDDEEDADDRPRKKKKRKADRDEGGSYKTSPVRFIILGVLVTIMLVLGVLLFLKWQSEKQGAGAPVAGRFS